VAGVNTMAKVFDLDAPGRVLRLPALPWLRQLMLRRRVPLVSQMERTDCGAACLAMVLGHHGHAAPLVEVRELCGIGRDGASAAAIAQAARQRGLQAQAFRVTEESLGGLPMPAILHVDGAHFVVVERAVREGWSVLDPAGGRTRWSAQEMARRLSGVALVCTPSDGFERRRAPRPTLGRYLAQLRRCRSPIALVGACTLLLELVALVPPAATQVMVDHVILPQRDAWLWVVAAAVAAACASQVALVFVRDRVIHWLHAALDLSLMSGFVAHLLHLPLAALAQRPAGDLMQRVQANIELRDLSTRLIDCVLDSALVLAYAALMLAYHPLLGLGVLSSHGVRLALTQAWRGAQREAIGQEQAALGRERGAAAEALGAAEFVQAFGLAGALARRQRERLDERGNAALRRTLLGQRSARGMTAFDAVCHAALLAGAGFAVMAEQLTLGEFAGFLALHALLGRPLQSMAALAGELALLRGSLERIDDVLAAPVEARGGQVLPDLRGDIELRGVCHRYSRHAPWVLDGIDLRIAAGERVAIVGPSGAGKSTLARLVLGLATPTSGEERLDGHDLRTLDMVALRRRMAAVLQDAFVFDDTARANLALADDDLPSRDLHAAARVAQLHDVLEALPQGYDTPLGPGGLRLSAGQRQRLMIARALAHRPSVLVLDEATSHLDTATEAALQSHLDGMRCTQLVIAHRLATVRNADRILVMQGGRIVQSGRFEDLGLVPGVFRDLLQAGGAWC
jgi:ATP-binding cassette subfamily B protein